MTTSVDMIESVCAYCHPDSAGNHQQDCPNWPKTSMMAIEADHPAPTAQGRRNERKEGKVCMNLTRNIRDAVAKWADANMERKPEHVVYPMWDKIWCVRDQHLLFRLRLCGNDIGADIVIQSCCASYGASEEDWSGANFGNAQSVEQIAAMYAWMEKRANYSALLLPAMRRPDKSD